MPTEKERDILSSLTQADGKIVFMRACIDIVAYWGGSAFDHAAGIVHFFERSRDVVGSSIRMYKTETMSRARPIRKDSLGLVPFWFSKTKSRRDIYMLYLESTEIEGEASDRAFALHALEMKEEEVGFVRLVLPIDFVSDAKQFVALTASLVEKLEFGSGNAGYSVTWNTSQRFTGRSKVAMANVRNRYPGLDLADPGSTKYIGNTGIKSVNWLTLINKQAVEALGGRKKLAAALGKDVTVHDIEHGAIIQAGPAPLLGDVNRRDNVPLYHQVGRVLAPIRSKSHPPFLKVGPLVSKTVSDEWLSRFDE